MFDKYELTTILSGSVAGSSIIADLTQSIDLIWKIFGIIGGIIAICSFIKGAYVRLKNKIDKATEDGKVTKEELTDIVNEVKADAEELKTKVDKVKDDVENLK